MKKKKWLDLIKYILSFIYDLFKSKRAENEEKLDKSNKHLKQEYDKIDKNKEMQRNEKTNKRLKNMF